MKSLMDTPAAREDLALLLLSLNEWAEEMRSTNDNVRSLISQCNSEAAFKAQHRMKTVRER